MESKWTEWKKFLRPRWKNCGQKWGSLKTYEWKFGKSRVVKQSSNMTPFRSPYKTGKLCQIAGATKWRHATFRNFTVLFSAKNNVYPSHVRLLHLSHSQMCLIYTIKFINIPYRNLLSWYIIFFNFQTFVILMVLKYFQWIIQKIFQPNVCCLAPLPSPYQQTLTAAVRRIGHIV